MAKREFELTQESSDKIDITPSLAILYRPPTLSANRSCASPDPSSETSRLGLRLALAPKEAAQAYSRPRDARSLAKRGEAMATTR